MQVRILGPVEAESDGTTLRLRGHKQRVVLARLALAPGHVVSADELIDAGWGDDLPANPANALQYQVARLRKIIEPDPAHPRHLLTVGSGYRLDAATVTIDAREFEASMTDARSALETGDHRRAALLVDGALALWRGPALSDVRYDDFARTDAERLDEERVAAAELQIDVSLAAGRHAETTSALAQLTEEHPLREGLWARRALALYRSGRQSEALRVFQQARDTLADVGLDPGTELRDLERQVVEHDPALEPATPAGPATPTNLPAPRNRLIGRELDAEKVAALFEGGRLVTLLGPGGAGKTRLAIEVGRSLLDAFAGGVWFVPLDGLDDGSLLAAEVGRATGMRENPNNAVLDTLASHLGSSPVLVVLDNCEHLVDQVASFVHDLSARCDTLSVLTTSQIVLETDGEMVFAVGPLATPGHTPSIYDPITDIDSVALFVERAADAGAPVEDWDSGALSAVANIVSELDGMPLALELAAARTRSMSLGEIARGLSDRFAVLDRGPRTAPARQRSLRGAVEWSLDLLDDRQRAVMGKLSVFAGDFDAADAAAVVGDPTATVRDDLAALVDRSLLTRARDVAGTARFVMLETLRQHGAIDLETAQLDSARDAHLSRFVTFARDADTGIRGPDQIAWLHRFDASYDNIRSALAWSLEGGSPGTGIQLASHLGRYWDWRGLLTEGAAWTGRLNERAEVPVPGLPSTSAWSAFIAREFGDLEQARRSMDLAVSAAAALDDPGETAAALSSRLLLSRSAGDLESARSDGIAIRAETQRAGDAWLEAWAESALATVALAAADLDAAESHAHRSVELFGVLGDRRGQGWGLISLSHLALDRDEIDDAEHCARAALDAATACEDDRNALWALEILTEAALRRGDAERAAELWGAAHPLRESRGLAGSVSDLTEPPDLEVVLRNELGDRLDVLADTGRRDPGPVIAREIGALGSPEPKRSGR